MSASQGRDLLLDLGNIDALFDAPDADPFSTREVEVLGESGLDHVARRVKAAWSRRGAFARLVITLPADQIAPDTAERTRAAIARTCAAQLERNRASRRQAMRVGRRQLAIALAILAFDVLILAWISTWATDGPPGMLAGILAVLAIFAGSLAIWDAIESLVFNWVPFVLDDACYRTLGTLDVVVAPK